MSKTNLGRQRVPGWLPRWLRIRLVFLFRIRRLGRPPADMESAEWRAWADRRADIYVDEFRGEDVIVALRHDAAHLGRWVPRQNDV